MNKTDKNDIQFAVDRGYKPLGWVPGLKDASGKINPHVTRFYLGRNSYYSVFHVKPIYYETISGYWRPLSEVTRYHGNKKIVFTLDGAMKVHPRYFDWLVKRAKLINGQVLVESVAMSPYMQYLHDLVTVPKIGMTVTTVYPDPSPETTTVDGMVTDTTSTGTWATKVANPGTTANDSGTTSRNWAWWRDAGTWKDVSRGVFLFDTSSIADADTIDSAIFSNYALDKVDPNSDTPDVAVYGMTTASNTALAAGDFDGVGSTAYSDTVTFASISTSAYTDFTFNATGLSNISKTGVTSTCVRNPEFDVAASTPSTTNNDTYCRIYSADQTGTSNDPKLAVTHSGSTPTQYFSPSGGVAYSQGVAFY